MKQFWREQKGTIALAISLLAAAISIGNYLYMAGFNEGMGGCR